LSPIRHDYKPSASPKAKNPNVLPWFVAGLGLPLLGIALLLASGREPASEPMAVPPPDAVLPTEPALAEAIELEAADVIDVPVVAEPMEAATVDGFHPPLSLPPEYEKLHLTIKRGDTLDRLFRRNDLDLADLALMVRLPDAAPHLKKLIPGDELTIEHDDGRLMSLYREINLTDALLISKAEEGFTTELIERPLDVRRKATYGRIESSLYESAADAGLPDKTVMNLAGIFAWDVDFVLDIRRGDDYYLLYEQLYQDGEYIGDGEIIAAEFNNNGRTIQAIRYVDKDGRSDYFTPDGRSVRKAFLRAPVDFRVSSSFNPNRLHPVLKTVRPHRGTDYAAPRGTPIKATGDGKVIFRGVKSGYGNVVILQHGGNITTLYAHMSRFASSVRNGTRVRQGQTIGYVGKTGLVTGVHLHYEYRLNGVHRNSRTVKLPQADPIADEYRADFLASVEPILDELLHFKRTQVASLSVD
jgi:murein DD-endopeptidase MepM/ murein hydrolase activator NlpD